MSEQRKWKALISPHGHFPGGRFLDAGLNAVSQQIVKGAERFENGNRSFMQPRCVKLARMGLVNNKKKQRNSFSIRTCQGFVEHVTFHSDESDFCVLRIRDRIRRDHITVVGTFVSDFVRWLRSSLVTYERNKILLQALKGTEARETLSCECDTVSKLYE